MPGLRTHQSKCTGAKVRNKRGVYQSWQWVTFCDPWLTWPITHLTHDPHDPWSRPRQWHESITTTYESWWVHDYCLLFSSCNNVQSGTLDMAYSVNVFIVYVYTLHGNFTSWTRWTVLYFFNKLTSYTYTFTPHLNMGHWPVTHMTHSHLLTHLTYDPWPADPLSAQESTTSPRVADHSVRCRRMWQVDRGQRCTTVPVHPCTSADTAWTGRVAGREASVGGLATGAW